MTPTQGIVSRHKGARLAGRCERGNAVPRSVACAALVGTIACDPLPGSGPLADVADSLATSADSVTCATIPRQRPVGSTLPQFRCTTHADGAITVLFDRRGTIQLITQSWAANLHNTQRFSQHLQSFDAAWGRGAPLCHAELDGRIRTWSTSEYAVMLHLDTAGTLTVSYQIDSVPRPTRC